MTGRLLDKAPSVDHSVPSWYINLFPRIWYFAPPPPPSVSPSNTVRPDHSENQLGAALRHKPTTGFAFNFLPSQRRSGLLGFGRMRTQAVLARG